MMRHHTLAIRVAASIALCLPGTSLQAQVDVAPHGINRQSDVEAPPLSPQAAMLESASVVGRLAIQAVQGTEGGPKIADVPVEIELLHSGAVIKIYRETLDEHGVITLEDIPVAMEVTPLVKVNYAGVTYQQPGEPMNRTTPEQMIKVTCYEVTNEPPNWTIAMRHVMVGRQEGGVQVAEVVVINNPGDRTWTGIPDDSGRGVTCQLELPEQARDVGIGKGFHDWCCTAYEPGLLTNYLPLMPGPTELHYRYFLPADHGHAHIEVTAEAPLDHMMVIVPDELVEESVKTLRFGGKDTFGQQVVRYYQAAGLQKGESAQLVLAGLSTPAPKTAAAVESRSHGVRLFAAIGGGLLLIIAMVIIFARPPGKSATDSRSPTA